MRKSVLVVTICIAAATAALAGCGSSSTSAAKPAPTASPTPTPLPTATPTPSPVPTPTPVVLTKDQFISQADAVCENTNHQDDTIPDPFAAKTMSALISDIQQGEAVNSWWEAAITPLVNESPDAAELTSRWLSVDEADLAAQKTIFDQMIAAAKVNNKIRITELISQLADLPDHSSELSKYLTSYGLFKCAALESD